VFPRRCDHRNACGKPFVGGLGVLCVLGFSVLFSCVARPLGPCFVLGLLGWGFVFWVLYSGREYPRWIRGCWCSGKSFGVLVPVN
jgi:hypothetical protein